jgi:hypothetical protein
MGYSEHTSMLNLADQLATNPVEHSSEAIIAASNDKIPGRQRPCMENAIRAYGVSKRLNLFHAWKLVFVDAIYKIGNEQEFAFMIERCIAAMYMCENRAKSTIE